ncbi:MAG: hypothetical protein IT559_06500 [Alphaproteobacteria bacterium]|nr:hypothetical protein [Alphaproteobacteria bacterium]
MSNKPQAQKSKYLTLDGQDILADATRRSLPQEYLRTGSVVLPAIFAAAGEMVHTDGLSLFAGALGLSLGSRIEQRNKRSISNLFGRQALTTFCIDTKPEPDTKTPLHLKSMAKLMRNNNAMFAAVMSGTIPIHFAVLTALETQAESPVTKPLFSSAAFSLGLVVDEAKLAYIYNKVVQDEWAIVKWPEPLKETAPEKKIDARAGLLPAPVPAQGG